MVIARVVASAALFVRQDREIPWTNEQTGRQTVGSLLGDTEPALWASFTQSRQFQHAGTKGSVREDALATFLRHQLPSRYGVSRGEVLDVSGTRSEQVDVIVYDRHSAMPFFEDDAGTVIVAAEAVLAVVELKSRLSAREVALAVEGFRKVWEFRPWGQAWARSEPRGRRVDGGPRCFSSLFAFDTDLVKKSWRGKELSRVRTVCNELSLAYEHVNRVAVLSRGLALPAEGKVAIPGSESGVLGIWFRALRSFIANESRRR